MATKFETKTAITRLVYLEYISD